MSIERECGTCEWWEVYSYAEGLDSHSRGVCHFDNITQPARDSEDWCSHWAKEVERLDGRQREDIAERMYEMEAYVQRVKNAYDEAFTNARAIFRYQVGLVDKGIAMFPEKPKESDALIHDIRKWISDNKSLKVLKDANHPNR